MFIEWSWESEERTRIKSISDKQREMKRKVFLNLWFCNEKRDKQIDLYSTSCFPVLRYGIEKTY